MWISHILDFNNFLANKTRKLLFRYYMFFYSMEVRGFEPLTYCVQGSCSPS